MPIWLPLLFEFLLKMFENCPERIQARRRERVREAMDDLASKKRLGLRSHVTLLRAVRATPMLDSRGDLLMSSEEPGQKPTGRRAVGIVGEIAVALSAMDDFDRDALLDSLEEGHAETHPE